MPAACCGRCLRLDRRDTIAALLAEGWQKKRPEDDTLYGWLCPACVGQPTIVRKRGKRSR